MAIAQTLTRLLMDLWTAASGALIFVGVVLAAYLPGRFLFVPLLGRLADAVDVDDTFRLPLIKVANAMFALFGLYLAIPLSGLVTTPTAGAAITAGATIALGFAARDVLGNFVSGVFIVTDPTFHIGDWIEWDGKEGIIEDISFRVTRVHTFDNEVITVPNSQLTDNAVVNPVARDRLRLSVDFGIGYEDDIEAARDVIVDVAGDQAGVLDRPRASVVVSELADSYVGLTAQFWIADPARADTVRIQSQFVQTVKERFDAAGIEMPYPYRQVTGELGTYDAGPPER